MSREFNRGDIVWIDLQPKAGREHDKRRPFLVLSPKAYNTKVGLLIGCPITSKEKGYPFEVKLPGTSKAKGVVLSDQIKSLDWRVHNATYLTKVSNTVVENVLQKTLTLLK